MSTYNEKTFALIANTTISDLYVMNASALASQVVSIQASNKTGFNATLDIEFFDSSAANSYKICNGLVVPSNSIVQLTSGRIILEPGDKLRAFAGTANAVTVLGGAVERAA